MCKYETEMGQTKPGKANRKYGLKLEYIWEGVSHKKKWVTEGGMEQTRKKECMSTGQLFSCPVFIPVPQLMQKALTEMFLLQLLPV